MAFGVIQMWLQTIGYNLLVKWPWESCLYSLSLCFFIFNLTVAAVCISQNSGTILMKDLVSIQKASNSSLSHPLLVHLGGYNNKKKYLRLSGLEIT